MSVFSLSFSHTDTFLLACSIHVWFSSPLSQCMSSNMECTCFFLIFINMNYLLLLSDFWVDYIYTFTISILYFDSILLRNYDNERLFILSKSFNRTRKWQGDVADGLLSGQSSLLCYHQQLQITGDVLVSFMLFLCYIVL